MKGLLLKDWYQVKTNMRMMYLTVLAVLAIWTLSTSGDSSFAVNYSAVFLGIHARLPAFLRPRQRVDGVQLCPAAEQGTSGGRKISRGSALRCGRLL